MKFLSNLILLIFFTANIYSQQQIPNGNFENRTNNEADFWNSSINAGVTIYTAEQTSDSYQGNYAAKLTSMSVFGQFIPGFITLGEINFTDMTLTGGTPYTDRPDGINFFFKYLPSGVDTMFFAAFLTHWNNTAFETDTIGMTGYFTADTYDSYTQINLPFIYTSAETPDTLNIIFTSSGFNGNGGSTLFIDSLSMINGSVISPTFCFPATDITGSSFTANRMTMPNAESYG